jgi:hypothetical protein
MTMPLGVTPDAGGIQRVQARRTWMTAAVAAVVVAAIAGVGYAVSRSQIPQPKTVAPPKPTPPPVAARPDTTAKQQAAAPKPKPIITHADSLKIAEIVRKRIEAAKISDSIAKAKLAQETQRKLMDSIIAANSGGVAGSRPGPRRLVIAETPDVRNWPEATLLGRAVADSLRRTLRIRQSQYTVVDQDSVRAVLAKTRNAAEISKALNAELIVSIQLQPLRADSALLSLTTFDMGAVPQYRTRNAGSRPTPKSEVLAGLDQVLLSTITYLDEMSRAPRRPPVPGAP